MRKGGSKRSRQEKKGGERKEEEEEEQRKGGEEKGGPLIKEATCKNRNKGEWEGQVRRNGGIKMRKPSRKKWWNPQAASYCCC